MQIPFKEIIKASWARMVTTLFRPFNARKWVVLMLIALLAGELSQGSGVNWPSDGGELTVQEEQVTTGLTGNGTERPAGEVSGEGPEASDADSASSALVEDAQSFIAQYGPLLLGLGGLLILILILLFMWLAARFSFVFLDNIVRNRADVRSPFVAYRTEGHSLFLWNIFMGFVFLLFLAASVFGVARSPWVAIPLFAGTLLIWICMSWLLRDFVLPVMYKKRVKILKAWGTVLRLLGTCKVKALLYLLIKIGLGIGAGLVTLLAIVAAVIVVLIPVVVSVMLGAALLGILPTPVQILLAVIGTVIGLGLLIGLIFLVLCIGLPAVVYFRIFSLGFLGAVNPEYNLFAQEG